MRTGERLPAFSVRLDPPLVGDAAKAAMLAAESAERYGRDIADVESERQNAYARIEGPRRLAMTSAADQSTMPSDGAGLAIPDRIVAGAKLPDGVRGRAGERKNSKRGRGKRERKGTPLRIIASADQVPEEPEDPK